MNKTPAYLARLTAKQIKWVASLTAAQVEAELSRRAYPYSFRDSNELDLYDALTDRSRGR